MPDTPARGIRYSLITLIVAVNVAGLLVWLNVRDHVIGDISWKGSSRPIILRGWPMTISRTTWIPIQNAEAELGERIRWAAVFNNIIVALVLLIAVVLVTEFLVCRFRETKRHDE